MVQSRARLILPGSTGPSGYVYTNSPNFGETVPSFPTGHGDMSPERPGESEPCYTSITTHYEELTAFRFVVSFIPLPDPGSDKRVDILPYPSSLPVYTRRNFTHRPTPGREPFTSVSRGSRVRCKECKTLPL